MNSVKKILVVTALLALVAGCAAKSDPAPMAQERTVIIAERMGHLNTFTNDKTGKTVTVSICESYTYAREVNREFEGVTIKGHLYTKEGDSGILVTKLPRADFERLVNVNLNAPMTGTKAYPPKTIYQSTFCELIRAYVVAFDGEVVAAIKAKGLAFDTEGCGNWVSLDDVMAEAPELVVEFDQSADSTISMEWD